MRSWAKCVPVLICGLVAIWMSGCVGKVGAGLPNGRQIEATSDSFSGLTLEAPSPTPDDATITIAGKTIIVEKAQVRIDGVVKATFPAESRKVVLTHRKKMLEITADGKSVYEAPL